MSIIFYHNEDQKTIALKSMLRKADSVGKAVLTEVTPYSEFYLAEDYHQKYYLQGEQVLLNEFTAMCPKIIELIQSTAAARVNGYIGGYGKIETLQDQLNLFGLTPGGKEKLLQIGSRLPASSN
jgi:peptide-methionine (S)-S-oxide reductase